MKIQRILPKHSIMITDGLSDATIEAIKADLVRSYDLATMFKIPPNNITKEIENGSN